MINRYPEFKIMKDDEFAVLCVLSGINKFFGTLNISVDNLSKQNLYNIIYKLVNKQIVVYEGNEMVISKDIIPIIEELRNAENIISFINTSGNINQTFYHNITSEYCINIEKRWEDSKSIWIRRVKKEDILYICYDIQILPNIVELKHLKEEKKDTLKEVMNLENVSISLYDISTETKYREIVFDKKGLEISIVLKADTKELYRELYAPKILEDLVTSFIGE